MSATVSSILANQDRPLLFPSPLPTDQRGGAGRSTWTLLDLLTVEKLDGLDPRSMMQSEGGGGGGGSRWRILKERLGLKIVGCCGVATWRYGSSTQFHDNNDDQNDIVVFDMNHPQEINQETIMPTSSGINLATALAAEREYRAAGEGDTTPSRVSLMRLLEETAEGGDLERERKGEGGERRRKEEEEGGSDDRVCCVCMGRNKDAALIPCGHTYCRVCSRELWLNRGSCPLCNKRIVQILDIF